MSKIFNLSFSALALTAWSSLAVADIELRDLTNIASRIIKSYTVYQDGERVVLAECRALRPTCTRKTRPAPVVIGEMPHLDYKKVLAGLVRLDVQYTTDEGADETIAALRRLAVRDGTPEQVRVLDEMRESLQKYEAMTDYLPEDEDLPVPFNPHMEMYKFVMTPFNGVAVTGFSTENSVVELASSRRIVALRKTANSIDSQENAKSSKWRLSRLPISPVLEATFGSVAKRRFIRSFTTTPHYATAGILVPISLKMLFFEIMLTFL